MALPLSYNVRSILVRWKVTLLALGGISLVVAVLVALTAMANGFRVALRATGSPENAIVTQRGSGSELTSGFSRDNANTILVDDRVQRDAEGRPMASPEVVVVAALPRPETGTEVNVTVRGVSPMAFAVRHAVEIARGRHFTPGLYELVIGEKVADRYGLDVGSTLRLQRQGWDVVGVFSSGGSGFESEIWGDVEVLGPAFMRGGGYQSLTLRLKDPSAVDAFDGDLRRNPSMQVQMTNERQYYEGQAGQTAETLTYLAVFVGVVMGIGAIFGAMNTMYALVAARTREIGTLRALGFSRSAVLVAFMIESAFLALIGGIIGACLALPINSLSGATGGANFSEVAFAFRVSPPWLGAAVAGAIVMGLLGGLLPAFRAARTPITAALRDT